MYNALQNTLLVMTKVDITLSAIVLVLDLKKRNMLNWLIIFIIVFMVQALLLVILLNTPLDFLILIQNGQSNVTGK